MSNSRMRRPGLLLAACLAGGMFSLAAIAKCPPYMSTWDRIEADTDVAPTHTPSAIFVLDFERESFDMTYGEGSVITSFTRSEP